MCCLLLLVVCWLFVGCLLVVRPSPPKRGRGAVQDREECIFICGSENSARVSFNSTCNKITDEFQSVPQDPHHFLGVCDKFSSEVNENENSFG